MKNCFGALFLIALCSCQPTIQTHGNISIVENIKKFEVGKTKITDVYRLCGSPSLKKDDFTLIYLSWKTEDVSFKKLKVADKTAIRLHFSHDGVLQKIDTIDNPGENKEMQLVSNEEGIQLISESDAEKIVRASSN